MSEEKTSYLASDLAAELGVPRTTVNDWLNRYAAFLEFETRGKRRAYPERSLAILREVSALRSAGRSAAEIESELARRHGIHPEIAAPAPVPEPAPAAPAGPETTAAPSGSAEVTASAALIRRDEANDFERIVRSLEAQEERIVAIRRFWRTLLLLLLLLLLAVGIPLIVLTTRLVTEMRQNGRRQQQQLEELSRGNLAIGEELRSSRTELAELRSEQLRRAEAARQAEAAAEAREAERRKQLAAVTAVLDRARSDYQENVRKLTAQLEAQRREAEAEWKRMEADGKQRAEAELAKLREEFARRQKAVLEQLKQESERRNAAELAAAEAREKLAAARQAESVAAPAAPADPVKPEK